MESIPAEQTQKALDQLGCISERDLSGDIERLIHSIALPYVDDSNVLMHEDELRAECLAKLARVIVAGHLLNCPTRAKAFGFIKTVMKNHIRSLVEKFAFAQRRTGVKTVPRRLRSKNGNTATQPKLVKLSLNEEDVALRVGLADPTFKKMELLEELAFRLTPHERQALTLLLLGGDEDTEPRVKAAVTRIKKKARAVVAEEV